MSDEKDWADEDKEMLAKLTDKGWKHWACPKCGAKYESPIRIRAYSHKCGAVGNRMVAFRRVKP